MQQLKDLMKDRIKLPDEIKTLKQLVLVKIR